MPAELFSPSKALRVLGVVDFVFFILSLLSSPRITINGEAWTSEGNGFRCCGLKVSIMHQLSSAIRWLSSFSLVIATTVFLWRDTRVCKDQLLDAAFWTAIEACTLSLIAQYAPRIMPYLYVSMSECWSRFGGTKTGEGGEQEQSSPIDNSNATDVAFIDVESAAASTQPESSPPLSTSFDVDRMFSSIELRIQRMLEIPAAMKALIGLVVAIFFLVLLGYGAYGFVTVFKLSIPSEYSTSCAVEGRMSTILLFVFQSAVVLYAVAMISWAAIGAGLVFQALAVPFLVALTVAVSVFYSILVIRSGRVWRGEDVNLYEFFAWYVALTLGLVGFGKPDYT